MCYSNMEMTQDISILIWEGIRFATAVLPAFSPVIAFQRGNNMRYWFKSSVYVMQCWDQYGPIQLRWRATAQSSMDSYVWPLAW